MELAESKPHADWNAIRAEFLAANKLDTEDPEPLFRYYESFVRAGEHPTANATAGLQYAMVLAPQDKGVRMTAVAEMINAGKLAEAKEALTPLAFDPHSSEMRDLARTVMDALSKQDQKAALAG